MFYNESKVVITMYAIVLSWGNVFKLKRHVSCALDECKKSHFLICRVLNLGPALIVTHIKKSNIKPLLHPKIIRESFYGVRNSI